MDSLAFVHRSGHGFGDLSDSMHHYGLMSPQFAADDLYLAFGYAELFSKELDQVGIGFTVYWRGGDGQLQLITMPTLPLISAGLGLYVQMQRQLRPRQPGRSCHQNRIPNRSPINSCRK